MTNTEPSRIFFKDAACAVVYKMIGENAQTFFTPLFTGYPYAQTVNRLDTPVSGLQIIAFSKPAYTALTEAFQTGQIKKEYIAICQRPPDPTARRGVCDDWLIFDRTKQKSSVVLKNSTRKPKRAVLEWEVAGEGTRYDFLRLRPKTGRTHQIRVQLANIHRPIKGDLKYGARRSEKNGGIRLHASAIEFPHPISREKIRCACLPVPSDTLWQACAAALEDHQ